MESGSHHLSPALRHSEWQRGRRGLVGHGCGPHNFPGPRSPRLAFPLRRPPASDESPRVRMSATTWAGWCLAQSRVCHNHLHIGWRDLTMETQGRRSCLAPTVGLAGTTPLVLGIGGRVICVRFWCSLRTLLGGSAQPQEFGLVDDRDAQLLRLVQFGPCLLAGHHVVGFFADAAAHFAAPGLDPGGRLFPFQSW